MNAEEYLKRGKEYFDKGDYKQAISDVEMAIKIQPDNQKARDLLAYLKQQFPNV